MQRSWTLPLCVCVWLGVRANEITHPGEHQTGFTMKSRRTERLPAAAVMHCIALLINARMLINILHFNVPEKNIHYQTKM